MFIGSSSEAKDYVKAIQKIIERDGHEVRAWWKAFPAGSTFIDALEKSVAWSDCALFIAAAEDIGISRGKKAITPRDNVLFEYALFASRHGRARVALATLEDEAAKLPTDLSGVTHLVIKKPKPQISFAKLNGEAIRDWLKQMTVASDQEPGPELLYRTFKVEVGNIPALLANEIAPRIARASEIDLLSMYRGIDVHRHLDAFRATRRNRLRMCFLDAWDPDLVAIYQRKFGSERDQAYMQGAILRASENFIGPSSFNSKRLTITPRKAPVANYDIRLTGQRITYDYCRVDDVALLIPLDMKLEQNPQPPAWLITRDEHPEIFSFYLGDFADVFKNARSVYASRRLEKK